MRFHCFDCNLATARFLDEVQSYSGVNKMSAQNLATVFGPNILRPKVEDPLTIMEGKWMITLDPHQEENQVPLFLNENVFSFKQAKERSKIIVSPLIYSDYFFNCKIISSEMREFSSYCST